MTIVSRKISFPSVRRTFTKSSSYGSTVEVSKCNLYEHFIKLCAVCEFGKVFRNYVFETVFNLGKEQFIDVTVKFHPLILFLACFNFDKIKKYDFRLKVKIFSAEDSVVCWYKTNCFTVFVFDQFVKVCDSR